MYQLDSKIISKKQISEKYFLFTFESTKIAKEAKPGQFVMIKIDDNKTFLRRPFSICCVNKNRFNIVFKVVGRGTEILSQKKVGDILNIIGPLGNLYPISQSPIFVAGGTGIASLLFLAQSIRFAHPRINSGATIFIGAKTKKDILFESEFKKLGCKVIVSTEDGSYGKKGLITDIFKKFLLPTPYSLLPVVYTCGPKPMLKKIAGICEDKKLKCFVSLEEKMACGIGACMGCIIPVQSSEFRVRSKNLKSPNYELRTTNYELAYKRVCKDGPVFDAEKIIWE
ncbi:MAG: dihydroorotate dehydrogenase electron transfer subunit [Elusimicrobia bacterium]|nr:dihydroorotate dehydrogenase electron transfer subunit [Elusimicrobiota bacterium]